MRSISGAKFNRSPPPARISSSNSNVGWNMMYAPLLQSKKGEDSFGHGLWRCGLQYRAIFGAPVLPVGPSASCTPSSLHPCTLILAAIYLDGVPTLITGMNSCATACLGPVLVPIAQPHQRVKACRSTTGACMCPCVQACRCSLYVVFAIMY